MGIRKGKIDRETETFIVAEHGIITGGQKVKKETNKMLLIISAILGVAALILIVLSIVGDFKTNWVLAAGLGCIALGSLINFINMIKNKKK